MNLFKVLMFVFVSSLVCQNAYPQQDKFDSELGLFLKEKNYEAIQLGRFITGHLYLTAEVNGTNATFVLDTFAVSSVMEEKKESKFNLTTSLSESKAVGAGGNNLALKETSIKNFCIKNYVLHDYKIHLMNLDHVNNAFKKVGIAEIDGVIGADILIRGKAVIDYEKLILYLKK